MRVGQFLAALVLALVATLAQGVRAQDLQPLPDLKSPVTDITGTLSAEQASRLDRKLRAFEARKGSQIAVVLVPTTMPEAIEDYSIRLAEKARIGRKGADDGLIILLAVKDRKTRIEVGYGLEGAIPDSVAARVRQEIMNPAFREGRFYDGLDAATDQFIKLIDGEKLPPPKSQPGTTFDNNAPDIEGLFVIGLVLVIVVGGILRAIFGRFLGSAAIGGLTGTAAWFITGLAAAAGIAGVLAFVFSLVFAGTFGRVGGGRRGAGWSNGGWGSGGWTTGGGWGSSGGGGGWSGGGGTFGGGGSSGSWDN